MDDSLKMILEQMDGKMDLVLAEVRRTNGRVTTLEGKTQVLENTTSRVKGAMWMLGILFTIITTILGIFKR
jgi:hypothetical protein